jgi:lysine biosynthesis protein LysW
MKMPKAYCPECDAVIRVDHPKLDAQLRCPECKVQLEVISVDPFDVYYAYDSDWDDIGYEDADWDDDEYAH